MGVCLTGSVNAHRAQWGCRYIPVNAKGEQMDCTVSGDKPGFQQDCVVSVCVWMRDVGRLDYIVKSLQNFDVQNVNLKIRRKQ